MPSTALTPPPAVVRLSERDSASCTSVFIAAIPARTRTRAQVLLKLGDSWSEAEVCPTFDV